MITKEDILRYHAYEMTDEEYNNYEKALKDPISKKFEQSILQELRKQEEKREKKRKEQLERKKHFSICKICGARVTPQTEKLVNHIIKNHQIEAKIIMEKFEMMIVLQERIKNIIN